MVTSSVTAGRLQAKPIAVKDANAVLVHKAAQHPEDFVIKQSSSGKLLNVEVSWVL